MISVKVFISCRKCGEPFILHTVLPVEPQDNQCPHCGEKNEKDSLDCRGIFIITKIEEDEKLC